jgi:hypothetical protein
MTGSALLWVIYGVVMLVLAAVDQRALWRATAAWQYRNPEANEPSGARLAIGRVALVVTAPMSFFVASILWAV